MFAIYVVTFNVKEDDIVRVIKPFLSKTKLMSSVFYFELDNTILILETVLINNTCIEIIMS